MSSQSKFLKQLDDVRFNNKSPYSILNCDSLRSRIAPFCSSNFTVIGGSTGVGLSAFMAENAVMNLLKLDSLIAENGGEVPTDAIIIQYFALGKTELEVVLEFACLYIKHRYKMAITPSDIRGDYNATIPLYDDSVFTNSGMNEEDIQQAQQKVNEVLTAIDEAIDWVGAMVDHGFLTINAGAYNPSDIINTVFRKYDGLYGAMDKDDEVFELKDEYLHSQFVVFIDGMINLMNDVQGHGVVTGADLHKLMLDKIKYIRFMLHSSVIVSIPTEIKYARSYKDTEPVCKHLGDYGIACNTGIILYDPIAEKHKGLLPKDEENDNLLAASTKETTKTYLDEQGNNYLRYWFLVRNTTGPSNAKQKTAFCPGTGAFKEIPKDVLLTKVAEVKNYIIKL